MSSLTVLVHLHADIGPSRLRDVPETVVHTSVVVHAGVLLYGLDEVDVEHLFPHGGRVEEGGKRRLAVPALSSARAGDRPMTERSSHRLTEVHFIPHRLRTSRVDPASLPS